MEPDPSHVFAEVIVAAGDQSAPPPPPPPPPPPLPSYLSAAAANMPSLPRGSSAMDALDIESPRSDSMRRPSMVRFNSQPEYFDYLQESGQWSSGKPSPRSPADATVSPPPPPPPPPPQIPPPEPPSVNSRTGEFGDFKTFKHEEDDDEGNAANNRVTAGQSQSGEDVMDTYATVDRSKKKTQNKADDSLVLSVDIGDDVTRNDVTLNDVTRNDVINGGVELNRRHGTLYTDPGLLDELLTPGTLPFSPNPRRGSGSSNIPPFAFQALTAENRKPTIDNNETDLEKATAIVDSLGDSLNNVNMHLFEKERGQQQQEQQESHNDPNHYPHVYSLALEPEASSYQQQQTPPPSIITSARADGKHTVIVSLDHNDGRPLPPPSASGSLMRPAAGSSAPFAQQQQQQQQHVAVVNLQHDSSTAHASPSHHVTQDGIILATRVDRAGNPVPQQQQQYVSSFNTGASIGPTYASVQQHQQFSPTNGSLQHPQQQRYAVGPPYVTAPPMQPGYIPHGTRYHGSGGPQPYNPAGVQPQLVPHNGTMVYGNAAQQGHWMANPGNVTVVSVDGPVFERTSDGRGSRGPGSLDRQQHVGKAAGGAAPRQTMSLDRGGGKPAPPVRNGSLKKPPPAANGRRKQPPSPEDDVTAQTLSFELQIKRRLAAQRRTRCCRVTVLVLVLVIIACVAIGLGVYFADQGREDGAAEGQ